MNAVLDQVLATIKKARYKASELARTRLHSFQIPESLGVRLGLLLLAVKPLRKASRMSVISEQIQGMTDEEVYYWFSKATHGRTAARSQRALRVILAEE